MVGVISFLYYYKRVSALNKTAVNICIATWVIWFPYRIYWKRENKSQTFCHCIHWRFFSSLYSIYHFIHYRLDFDRIVSCCVIVATTVLVLRDTNVCLCQPKGERKINIWRNEEKKTMVHKSCVWAHKKCISFVRSQRNHMLHMQNH